MTDELASREKPFEELKVAFDAAEIEYDNTKKELISKCAPAAMPYTIRYQAVDCIGVFYSFIDVLRSYTCRSQE